MSTNWVIHAARVPAAAKSSMGWVYISAALTGMYIVFALILVGVPQVSRLGIVSVLLSAVWLLMGILSRKAQFPKILALPIVFYVLILVSGVVKPIYPVEYMGQVTTIWVGGIVIAAFVANGVSLNLLIVGFVGVFIANLVAINLGYDTYQLFQNDSSLDTIALQGVDRASGLAGNPNLLISLVFTLPFLLFLNRQTYSIGLYLACIAGAIVITFATGSRSAIPFTVAFAVFGALFLIKNRFFQLVTLVTGLVLAVVFWGFLGDPYYLSKLENSSIGDEVIVQRALSAIDQTDNSSEIRSALATEFWPHFYRKPLFGYGPNEFANVAGDGLYAHNNFAEIAIDWGSVGLVIFYSLYVAIIVGIVLRPDRNYFLLAPLAFLVMADFAFVTFLDRAMVLSICLMLVILFGADSSKRHRRSSRRSSRKKTEFF